MTIFIRILDVLTFLVLLLSLQFSYGRRFNRAQNAFSVLLLCLSGLAGTILEEQVQGINFFLYAVNFILWGSVYSYFCLKGQFGLKLAMTTVFCVSVFYSFEFAHLLGALFHVSQLALFLPAIYPAVRRFSVHDSTSFYQKGFRVLLGGACCSLCVQRPRIYIAVSRNIGGLGDTGVSGNV